jgi:PAS domain S-box-containing protein
MITRKGEVVGVLSTQFTRPHRPSVHELQLMDLLAWTAANFIERHSAAVERARTEEALRVSEEKYHSLFNSIDEGFNLIEVIFDDSGKPVDHRILEANLSQEKMTGLKDVVGKRARELLPDIEDYWIENFGQVAITGKPVRLENRIEGLDRWFDVYASRVGGEGSRKVAVIFNDITQRKRAEEALHQSEERLNFALETIHTGAWDLDLVDHDSPHRSIEHDRIFGYEQLLPKWTYEMFLNHVLPDDRSMVDEKFQKAITSGGDWSFECRIRRVDDVIRWIWAAGRHQVDSTGNVRWMAGIVQDITERKLTEEALRESEAKYRDVFETVQEVFYVDQLIYDEQGNVVDWIFEDLNPAGFELLGLKGIDEAKGKRGSEVLGREVASFYLPMIEKARQSSKAVTFQYRSPYVDREFLTSYTVRGDRLISAQMDVTELKKIEAALRESEERLRLLSDNLPDSAVYQYIHEPDGSVRFLYFSAGIEKLNGIKVSDVLRNPGTLHRQIPPEYFERLLEAEAKSARELSDFDMETPMQLSNGQIRWMQLHSRPRRLPDGRTIWDGVQIDITERKRTEKALKTSEACIKVAEAIEIERKRLFDVLETLPVMICLLTPDYHVAFANRSFREKFGDSGSRHCYEYRYGLTEPCEFCESYIVLETGQPQHWEVTTPEGSAIDVYDFPFTDIDGSPMILKMDIDITDRKNAEEKLRDSEEKYRNIVETANEIILITNNENVITYVNKKIEDMLGYTPEQVIGRPIWGFISKEYIHIIKMNLEKRKQGISGSYESKLTCKDGSSVWVLLNTKPLFDKEGKYIGAMSMLTDITKRKEAEETLTNIETARKKEIHHRIKNNLQVISSLLDLQAEQFRKREDIRDSEVLEAFRESQDRVISMALIHEELYKGGGFETLNFSPYIEELAKNLFKTYSLGNTDFTLSKDLEENAFFDMDTAVPLGIIVNELVSNSLKHAFQGRDEGEIQIKLHREGECKREGSKSASFVLTVSDNGVGIPENLAIEDLESLGLQLVTTLVDQLGGELEIKKNNGTEFTMRFTVTEKDSLAQSA